MKKLLIAVLFLCLLLGCAACGGSNNSTTNENGSNGGDKPEKTEPIDSENPGGQSDSGLPGTVEVSLPNVKFSVDAPDRNVYRASTGFRTVADSYAVIYDCYVDPSSQLLYEVELEKVKGPEDVLVQMEKQIISNCETCLISASEYSLAVDKTENVKVNGWNMCRSEGEIHLEEIYKLDYDEVSFVSYSLIKDGYPVYFLVMDIPAEQADHINIGELADRIANTFRDNS